MSEIEEVVLKPNQRISINDLLFRAIIPLIATIAIVTIFQAYWMTIILVACLLLIFVPPIIHTLFSKHYIKVSSLGIKIQGEIFDDFYMWKEIDSFSNYIRRRTSLCCFKFHQIPEGYFHGVKGFVRQHFGNSLVQDFHIRSFAKKYITFILPKYLDTEFIFPDEYFPYPSYNGMNAQELVNFLNEYKRKLEELEVR